MRIGIDIDDTLTDIREILDNEAYKYAISLGKDADKSVLPAIHKDPTIKGIYKHAFGLTEEESAYYFTNIKGKITDNAIPRENCVDVLHKLKSDGHEIIIITARSPRYHKNVEERTITWLKKHNIPYDKLIINSEEKAIVCEKENIDLFIDDNVRNCQHVENIGIQVIIVREDKSDTNSCNDWLKIYDKINNEKIIKIKRFENKYRTQVKEFINTSMFEFLNRPHKIREDIENIEDYYFKRNGNFWCAIDINNDKVIGTIGIENDGNTGVLKRFYVAKEYQKLNIGKRLFDVLINFIKTETKIKTIYLNCDKRLTNARKFYNKYGFKITNDAPEKMSKKPEDDVFELIIESN